MGAVAEKGCVEETGKAEVPAAGFLCGGTGGTTPVAPLYPIGAVADRVGETAELMADKSNGRVPDNARFAAACCAGELVVGWVALRAAWAARAA